VNKYFCKKYVEYREGYLRAIADDYYTAVGLMSDPEEQQRYLNEFSPNNPQAPLNIYGDKQSVRIEIKSISFLKPNVALVRYLQKVIRSGEAPALSHWAATITFRYGKAPESEKDRGVSPLGFRVVNYRRDPETLVPEPQRPPNETDPVRTGGPAFFAPAKPPDHPDTTQPAQGDRP
jgi:type IV secretion system protein VirB8